MESEQEQYQLLTIEEMMELLQTDRYRLDEEYEEFKPEFEKDPETGLYFTDYFKEEDIDHLLYNHLLAELCIAHRKQLDWGRTTDGYNCAIIAKIVAIYSHPLVWSEVPYSVLENYVITGRFAKEESLKREDYGELILFLLNESRELRALWFADHLPTRAIPNWSTLMTNYCRADLLTVPTSGPAELPLPHINTRNLEENLECIYLNRGKDKVVELVERLRNDWVRLEKLKLCGFGELSPEEIEQLKDYVFSTIDYRIEYWEMKNDDLGNVASDSPAPVPVCRYINREKILEVGTRTVEEYISQLRDACPHADTLGPFLLQGHEIGYLDFMGDSKLAVYNHLKECFPDVIKYGYPNFTQYFKI